MIEKNHIFIEYNNMLIGLEIINEYLNNNAKFSIEQNLTIASISCITTMQKVLLATEELEELTLILSYLYTPKQLMVLFDKTDPVEFKNFCEYCRHFSELYGEFERTDPIILNKPLTVDQIHNNTFDVIIYSHYTQTTIFEVECNERFNMMLGDEYDAFENVIKNSVQKLDNHGRLIILARACWILPVWEILDENNMQFEYQEYRYYLQPDNSQNRLVWISFSYKEDGIDTERQKRNIYQFMNDNNIDRLFAHRNNYLFPYVEPPSENKTAYIEMEQNRSNLQYFFSAETTQMLTELCMGYTACLVVPSVAVCAYDSGKNVVLFELDNRFRTNGGVKFVKYDLYKGLNNLTVRKFGKKFNTVICDPPFNIDLNVLAKDIYELISNSSDSLIYIVFPKSRISLLNNAMKNKSMHLIESYDYMIEYSKPPKLVRMEGADAIQLYKFCLLPL